MFAGGDPACPGVPLGGKAGIPGGAKPGGNPAGGAGKPGGRGGIPLPPIIGGGKPGGIGGMPGYSQYPASINTLYY